MQQKIHLLAEYIAVCFRCDSFITDVAQAKTLQARLHIFVQRVEQKIFADAEHFIQAAFVGEVFKACAFGCDFKNDGRHALLPNFECAPHLFVESLDDKNIRHYKTRGIAFFVIHQHIRRNIHISHRAKIVRQRVQQIGHCQNVNLCFTHRFAIGFRIFNFVADGQRFEPSNWVCHNFFLPCTIAL